MMAPRRRADGALHSSWPGWTAGQKVSLRLTDGSDTSSAAIDPDPEPQQSVAASVTGVEMASSAGADKTYGLDDIIQVRVASAMRST